MKPLCLESVVDTIFEACQSDVEGPGLVLEDVQRKACITAVDEIIGGSNGSIDDLFEAADSNGDGIVMRSEVSDAFKALTLQRSGKPTCETDTYESCSVMGIPYPDGCHQRTVFKCNGALKCKYEGRCRQCSCP